MDLAILSWASSPAECRSLGLRRGLPNAIVPAPCARITPPGGTICRAKKRNEALPDSHDYSEDQTRKFIIDLLLKEAGWEQGKDWSDEYPVTGMPNVHEEGKVDYVLWGDDGLPLAVVEAKRTSKDPHVGQQQAKLYADCLTDMKGRRPVIFYTNGYETWLWDDTNYPPRMVQGFYNKAELELLIQRRSLRGSLRGQTVILGVLCFWNSGTSGISHMPGIGLAESTRHISKQSGSTATRARVRVFGCEQKGHTALTVAELRNTVRIAERRISGKRPLKR